MVPCSIIRGMDLRILRYFLAVAEEGNITRASERLHVSQPALSTQLAALEDELGQKLFERGARGIELTEKGVALKRRADDLVLFPPKTDGTDRTFIEFRVFHHPLEACPVPVDILFIVSIQRD